MASWSQLKDGRTQAQIFSDILARLKGIGFRVDDWSIGAVVRTILDVGFSGALEALWSGVSSVTRGGFLRLAQELAEADIVDWTANPQDHWLYLLAVHFYETQPKPSAFTLGTIEYVNASNTPQTITPSHVVKHPSELLYAPIETKALPALSSVWVRVQADQPGAAYNVAEDTITALTVSLPGVTVRNRPDPAIPGQTSWILTYGADTESPKELADRCAFRWARLAKLQTLVEDGYRSLALESHPDVRKVAVWSNYSHALGGFKANSVTLYLGNLSGPVAAGVAAAVKVSMDPYVGICDVLEVEPCGVALWAPVATIYVTEPQHIPQAVIDVARALLDYQALLNIGETGLAWEVRARCNVPNVYNVVDAMTDFTPAKNALVSIRATGLTFLPRP